MHALPTGKNISIHFTTEELALLSEFDKFCKKNYTTKSGWVKRNIHRQLKQEQEHKASIK